MKVMQNKELQVFVSAAFAGLLYYLGIVSIPIIMLICAMIIDYVTGMLAASYNSELSSKKGIKGIVKKVGYLALVLASMIIDWLISQGLQQINSVCSIIKQLELFIVPKSQQEYRVKSCKQKGSCQIAEIHCENRKCNG